MNLKRITIIPLDDAVFKVSFFKSFIEKKMMIIIIIGVTLTITEVIIKINKMICLLPILNQDGNIKQHFNSPELPTNIIKISHV